MILIRLLVIMWHLLGQKSRESQPVLGLDDQIFLLLAPEYHSEGIFKRDLDLLVASRHAQNTQALCQSPLTHSIDTIDAIQPKPFIPPTTAKAEQDQTR